MFTISSALKSSYPEAHAGILVMKNVSNPAHCSALDIQKETLENQIKERFLGKIVPPSSNTGNSERITLITSLSIKPTMCSFRLNRSLSKVNTFPPWRRWWRQCSWRKSRICCSPPVMTWMLYNCL